MALTVAHGPTRLASVGASAKLAGEAKRALVIAPVERAATADVLAATGVDVVSLDEVIEWVDGHARQVGNAVPRQRVDGLRRDDVGDGRR